jgi:hypothetical protein
MVNEKFFLAIVITFAMALTVNSQVHIGANTPAHTGSVLDLTNSGNLGMKLPLVDLQNDEFLQVGVNGATKDDDLDAAGMMVYNTNEFELDGEGIYTWNGHKWTTLWSKGKVNGTKIPTPACSEDVVFMTYNLGADPQYNTPKKQMKYLSEKPFNENDLTVYGGLYQWGRKDLAHGARNAGTASGPTDTPVDGIFYTGGNGEDWRATQDDSLWGNGVSINTPTDPEGAFCSADGHHYQKPVKTANDPCPNGFRVPTQDEWERIGSAHNCDPSSTASAYRFQEFSAVYDTGSTTWVRVVDGKVYTAGFVKTGYRSGWAVYKTDVWNNALQEYKNGTSPLYLDNAPEPILFLPSGGYKSNGTGSVYGVGNTWYYWSSSIKDKNAYLLSFTGQELNPGTNVERNWGLSIRCVME